jgi:hypothetical protein
MPDKAEPFVVPNTTEAVVQADIGGMSVAFSGVVTDDELDAWLDKRRRAINRQRAQHELVEALVDVEARREALRTSPQREREMVKARTDERIRVVASLEAAHQNGGLSRVTEIRLTAAQKKGITDFDAETKRRRDEFETDREKVAAEIPHYEARAARARAIIGGAERSEVIGTEPLPAAAD